MKTLTMIEMAGCPYCANAHRAMDALRAEGGTYADVQVELIDENKEPAKTQPFAGQYYYVPSIFLDGEKLYEAQPGDSYDKILAEVKRSFDTAAAG
ncbi:hypothetical protein HMPREF1992_01829 [Selenomonas sp. oral taxon 892 str. F0426]|uniref:hypothetical protein n=1 Tax=Selenomonas sp. oral taxon 892 TaxID=1321785 RepID=UPI0003AD73F8|nr:hypothetical protein [Selenomonas sp. oral taxon 892]ERJ90255.1 hypothetical protein HMPREF1992_01829 [Selenomonas sp. oral taxon 892 str. F0426]